MAGREAWWRPEGRSPFALDPSRPARPQVIAILAHLFVILGGPLLALVTINHYPFLIADRTLYFGGLSSIVLSFVASFALIRRDDIPPATPLVARLLFRAGWGLGMAGLLLGLGGIANGYDTPLTAREAPVVAKHLTRHRDPARRTYYVAMRPWPDSRAVVELGAPRDVYDRLDVPVTDIDTPQPVLESMRDTGRVRLSLGEGRLGLEWLRQVSLP
jgi:hypothetical protein